MKNQNNGPPNGGSLKKDPNPYQPTPDQLYLAERLDDTLTPAAIVKLNKAHGRIAVLEAMRQLHGSPPVAPVEDVYGWLAVVASFKEVGS